MSGERLTGSTDDTGVTAAASGHMVCIADNGRRYKL